MLIACLGGAAREEPVTSLARIDTVLIILEVFALGFYVQATHRVPESRASAELVLFGDLAPLFWWGVAVHDLIVPLVLSLLNVFALEGAVWVALSGSVCGIIGGLCLRQVVLAAGIHAPLRVGRFEISLPIV